MLQLVSRSFKNTAFNEEISLGSNKIFLRDLYYHLMESALQCIDGNVRDIPVIDSLRKLELEAGSLASLNLRFYKFVRRFLISNVLFCPKNS